MSNLVKHERNLPEPHLQYTANGGCIIKILNDRGRNNATVSNSQYVLANPKYYRRKETTSSTMLTLSSGSKLKPRSSINMPFLT